MAMLDFLTEGAPIPAGTVPGSNNTTSSLPDWYSNYAMNLLSPQPMQQPQQPQQQQGNLAQQQPYQAYQQYQQQRYQQQQQQGDQAQQEPYSPFASPEWERAALQGLSQPYPQAPIPSPFAAPQPMPQQPMSQQPMSQQQMSPQQQQFARQQMSQLQLPGYPTQPDVIPYNNGYPKPPKPMYTPLPQSPRPFVPELMPDPTMPPGNFGTNISMQPDIPWNPKPMYPENTVNPYNIGNSPTYPKQGPKYGPQSDPYWYTRTPRMPNMPVPQPTPQQPTSGMNSPQAPPPANNPVAMARGGLFAVNRPAPRVSSLAVKQGRI